MTGSTPFDAAANAVVDGDAATLRSLLALDPTLVHARSTAEHRAPCCTTWRQMASRTRCSGHPPTPWRYAAFSWRGARIPTRRTMAMGAVKTPPLCVCWSRAGIRLLVGCSRIWSVLSFARAPRSTAGFTMGCRSPRLWCSGTPPLRLRSSTTGRGWTTSSSPPESATWQVCDQDLGPGVCVREPWGRMCPRSLGRPDGPGHRAGSVSLRRHPWPHRSRRDSARQRCGARWRFPRSPLPVASDAGRVHREILDGGVVARPRCRCRRQGRQAWRVSARAGGVVRSRRTRGLARSVELSERSVRFRCTGPGHWAGCHPPRSCSVHRWPTA